MIGSRLEERPIVVSLDVQRVAETVMSGSEPGVDRERRLIPLFGRLELALAREDVSDHGGRD